ncbi:MAG TPA: electron transfer flavoprotein subunit alpha/FixB family protein [Syntrophomonadaceae bacterium]|nr:electron transfer flavoprotein subunit alpha/FixB family protein [Syntrophomonadaceae bacterium]
MAGIYIYSDKANIAAELVTLARQAGKTAVLLAFDQDQADTLTQCGADQVCLLQGDSPLPENYAQAVADLLTQEGADLLAVGATARGRDLAARVAGYLDCGMASDVSSLSYQDGAWQCERMLYGGAVVQGQILMGLCVVTVPAGKFEAASGNCDITALTVGADTRVSLVEQTPIVKTGADLTNAERVVCVGMGLDKKEDLSMIQELANCLSAEIGCTRGVAEERHWLPVEQYIGISGAVIRPKLYLCLGVSGQVQHVVGVRDAKLIVAVDINEKAPIFRSADYGIVGDMYEVVPLLVQALKNA